MAYTRTNIYLTETQKVAIEEIALERGLKTAELIRRIIDAYLEEVDHAS